MRRAWDGCFWAAEVKARWMVLYLVELRGMVDIAGFRQRLHIAMLAIAIRRGLEIVDDLTGPLQDDGDKRN